MSSVDLYDYELDEGEGEHWVDFVKHADYLALFARLEAEVTRHRATGDALATVSQRAATLAHDLMVEGAEHAKTRSLLAAADSRIDELCNCFEECDAARKHQAERLTTANLRINEPAIELRDALNAVLDKVKSLTASLYAANVVQNAFQLRINELERAQFVEKQ